MFNSNVVRDNLSDSEIVEAASAGIAMVERFVVEMKLQHVDAPISGSSRSIVVRLMNDVRSQWLNEMHEYEAEEDWYEWHKNFSARIHMRRALIQMRESGTWIDWFPSA